MSKDPAMDPAFPIWPPGLTRRVRLAPRPGHITAGLEDDMHRFHLRLWHNAGAITRVEAEAIRHPWTACPGAAPFLAGELAGKALADVAALPAPEHCTHLRDLAILAAAHAGDRADTLLEMRVADRVGDPLVGRTTATLARNGETVLAWQLEGTVVAGPAELAGRDLRALSRWQADLTPEQAELSHALRRAVFVSGARKYEYPAGQTTADMGAGRAAVCFNYQPPQAAISRRPATWLRDFSESGDSPLFGFDADIAIA